MDDTKYKSVSLSPISVYDEDEYKYNYKILTPKNNSGSQIRLVTVDKSPNFEINLENIDLMHEIYVEKKDLYGTSYRICGFCDKKRENCDTYKKKGYDCEMIRFDGKKSFIIAPKKKNDKRYPKGKCMCNYPCKCNFSRYGCC